LRDFFTIRNFSQTENLEQAFHCRFPGPELFSRYRTFPERPPPTTFVDQTRREELPIGEVLDYILGTQLPYSAFHFFFQKKNLYPDPTFPYVPILSLVDSGGAMDSFEVLTVEYIQALAKYLKSRCAELHIVKTPIVEVGAGDGRLAYHINQSRILPVPVVATDVFPPPKPKFPVEILDHRNAIAKYHPQLILCSWMTFGEDWSAHWRLQMCNTSEYVLIGEMENCASQWETYGINAELYHKLPPYAVDGWDKVPIDSVSAFQLTGYSGTGDLYSMGYIFSQTISFRRVPQCFSCAKRIDPKVLLRCPSCYVACYCSVDCRNENWNSHGYFCRANAKS